MTPDVQGAVRTRIEVLKSQGLTPEEAHRLAFEELRDTQAGRVRTARSVIDSTEAFVAFTCPAQGLARASLHVRDGAEVRPVTADEASMEIKTLYRRFGGRLFFRLDVPIDDLWTPPPPSPKNAPRNEWCETNSGRERYRKKVEDHLCRYLNRALASLKATRGRWALRSARVGRVTVTGEVKPGFVDPR